MLKRGVCGTERRRGGARHTPPSTNGELSRPSIVPAASRTWTQAQTRRERRRSMRQHRGPGRLLPRPHTLQRRSAGQGREGERSLRTKEEPEPLLLAGSMHAGNIRNKHASTRSSSSHSARSGLTPDERIAAAVQVLAVWQVGAARHDQQQAACLPAARQQLCSIQAGHLHGRYQRLPQAVQRAEHGAGAGAGAGVNVGGWGWALALACVTSRGGGGENGGGGSGPHVGRTACCAPQLGLTGWWWRRCSRWAGKCAAESRHAAPQAGHCCSGLRGQQKL